MKEKRLENDKEEEEENKEKKTRKKKKKQTKSEQQAWRARPHDGLGRGTNRRALGGA